MKQKRTDKEIQAEKDAMVKQLEGKDIEDVLTETSEKGSRFYARKFKELYVGVRKGLILLAKQKRYKVKTNEEVYNESVRLLELFISE